MKIHDSAKSWKNAATGLSVFAVVGSLTYLILSGDRRPGEPATTDTWKAGEFSESGLVLGGQPVAPVGAAPPVSGTGTTVAPRTGALLVPKAPVEGTPLTAGKLNGDSDKGRVVRLKPASFQQWGKVSRGERIALPSVDGEELYGTVNIVKSDSGWYRMGGILDEEKGTFQLNASADQIHGGIYFPELGVGYQVQMDGSDVVLVERGLGSLICYPGIKPGIQGSTKPSARGSAAAASGTQVIPQLNTRPGARGVVYLDFAGGEVDSVAWSQKIVAEPSPLSGDLITQVVNRVAECYAPFDLTITTIPSVYQQTPVGRRMRTVVTPTDTAFPGAGGVAKGDSWKWGGEDIVCWVFLSDVKYCADAVSHEVGHTLGLKHHGLKVGGVLYNNDSYYFGHGGGRSVLTSWGPIMGAPYEVNLTQWSNGQYYNANNSGQDDLKVISTGNNFTYISSPGANGLVRPLPLLGPLFQTSGTLTSQRDSNVYQFTTTGGNFSASVRPTSSVGTGDFRLDLLDANGIVLVVADPVDVLGASISRSLTGGVYRLKVVPTGTGAPPSGGYRTGYSPYGSLGGYSLAGRAEGAHSLPVFLNPKLISGTEKLDMSVKFELADASQTIVTKVAEKLPDGLKFDSVNLVLSGVPVVGASSGVWSLTLVAKNSSGETRMQFDVVISEQSLGLSGALGSRVSDVWTPPVSPWIGVSKPLVSGTGLVAQSGPVADKGTSSIRCTYTAPGSSVESPWSVMTFYWQSDTEPGKDSVQCRVDGAVAKDMLTGKPLVLSGRSDWVKQTVLIPGAGKRTIEFSYTKDANLKSGADRVWVYGIEIGQPPVISTPPVRSLRVTPGTSVGSSNFSLSALATNFKTLAWWKNGVVLANGATPGGSIVSGADTGTLTITGAKAADAGVYWLVAKNDSGVVASTRTEVVVWVPPSVTSQPVAPIGLKVGDPLILTAQVSGAQPMYYQWKKDGVAGRWSASPNLMLNKTTRASAGKYVLVAVNPSGTVSSREVVVNLAQPTNMATSAAR